MTGNSSRTILRAATALDDALAALAANNRQIEAARDRALRLEKQAADLLEEALGDRGATANSLLVSLHHKLRSQRGSLGRAHREHETIWAGYRTSLEEFRMLLTRHNRHEEEKAADAAALRRCAGALHRTLDGMVRQRLRQAAATMAENEFRMPEESHSYIPFPVQRFFEALMRLDALLTTDPAYAADSGRYRPVSFLEVGCGSGRNMVLAQHAGLVTFDRCCGFDLDVNMVENGRAALDLGDDIFVGDALEFDYAPFDVVFSYRPIQTPEIQSRLEAAMVASMHSDAYLIAPMAEDLDRYPELRCVSRSFDIWRMSDRSAARL